MLGNSHVIESVKTLIEKKDVPHSWLFTGNSGCGKTTIARIIATELGATASGIVEINASDIRGIDGMREIIKQAQYRVPGSPISVYILDECHQLTKDAQNALLKILEDSPAHAYFVLATTDPQKLIDTIKTRCKQFKFEPLTPEDTVELVADVADIEGIKVSDDILMEIAQQSAGSPRLALNMLERCSALTNDIEKARKLICSISMDFQIEGEFDISGEIVAVLLGNRNERAAWKKISTILDQKILKANADVNAVKQGLTARLGRLLLTRADLGIAEAIILLETVKNMYSNASFVAVMYMLVKKYYKGGGDAKEVEGRSTIK
jgi:DNA polymerase III delta prime subunit